MECNEQTDRHTTIPAGNGLFKDTVSCTNVNTEQWQERDVVITLYLAPLSDLMVGILYPILSVQGKRYLFGIAKIQT